MSTTGIIKVSVACPVFDGTDYPYWKNKMRVHLEAIDIDLWYVVKNDVRKVGEGVTAAESRGSFNWTRLPRTSSMAISPKDSMVV